MALSADKTTEYTEGVDLSIPVDDADKIYAGAIVCVNASGYAVVGADAAGQIFMGIAREQADNTLGLDGAINVTVRRRGLFKMKLATPITIANVGDNVFIADDESVDLTGNVTNKIFIGIIASYIDTTHAWIDVEPAIRQADVATHIADGSAAHAAAAISAAAGGLAIPASVQEALAEIYTNILTAKGIIPIPTPAFDAAGVALAAFVSADAVTCGYCVTPEGMGIRWNNHATPGPAAATKVIVPPDADVTANMTLHILAAKVGATIGDAVKFTIEAFNNVVDAAFDADTDFGGDTNAMVGDDTTKHVQHLTRTLALADLTAYPAAMELTIKPKNGLLGTDDVIMLAAWIEYKKKLLTA